MAIFISYRRETSSRFAKELSIYLSERFGEHRVFFDEEAIEPGEDFENRLRQEISNSTVVLALVGEGWESISRNDPASPRLSELSDYVRRELLFARSVGKKIIPVIHGRDNIPSRGDIPVELDFIRELNGLFVREETGQEDGFNEIAKCIHRDPKIELFLPDPGENSFTVGEFPEEKLLVSVKLEPISGGRIVDLGGELGRVYLGGSRFDIEITNSLELPIQLRSMTIDLSHDDGVPLEQKRLPHTYKGIVVSTQLFIRLIGKKYKAIWKSEKTGDLRSRTYPVDSTQDDLIRMQSGSNMVFEAKPKETEHIEGLLIPEQQGFYDVSLTLLFTDRHSNSTRRRISGIRCAHAPIPTLNYEADERWTPQLFSGYDRNRTTA